MEVRVNGSNGLSIEEPVITASDVGINLFDWQGLEILGSVTPSQAQIPTREDYRQIANQVRIGHFLQELK